MKQYIVGKDPETGELIVGEHSRNVFFLRGPAMEETAIRNLVQAANERIVKIENDRRETDADK